jgi:uncharacterized phage protein (TIGR02220 family)
MTNKSPAFQFYPGDFLSDENVICMSFEERGIYITLLSNCWIQGSIPADHNKLEKLLPGINDPSSLNNVLERFNEMPGNPDRLINNRLEKEREKQDNFRDSKSESGKRGAEKRWENHEKKPLNSTAMNDSASNSDAIDLPLAKNSSLSSSSSSTSSSNNKPLSGSGKEKEKEILEYLNQKAGKKYKPIPTNLKFISGRLSEGYSPEDLKRVVDCKVKEWKGDPKMDKYLRPITLFNPSKFAGYANEMAPAKPRGEEPYIPPEPPKPRVLGDPVLEDFWKSALEKIKPQVGDSNYQVWLKPTYPRSLSDGKLEISVPNQFIRKNLIENYRGLIEFTLSAIRGSPIAVDFSIGGSG